MAERPIFIPAPESPRLVLEKMVEFVWNPGLAPIQKKRNVLALHQSAADLGIAPILECSTKSEEVLGQRLSAFNLKVETDLNGTITLECAFQGSKIFQNGGPFTDLFHVDSREAKKDQRLKDSGRLIGFRFEGQNFPIIPQTAFYDWLFIKSLFPHREYLKRLEKYVAFSDIEFNPERSINCQARSAALFSSLQTRDLLEESVKSPLRFIELRSADLFPRAETTSGAQERLF